MPPAFSLLALASAAVYGAADFVGGLTSRRADTIVVVLVSQAAGLVMVALLLALLPEAAPARGDWLWGGAAGLAGGVGVALLYKALAVGTMAVVAPVTAVCAVAIPVAVAIAMGERPGVQAWAGMVVALLAIALVSRQSDAAADPSPVPNERRSGLGLALAAGVAIGVFFLALARTNPGAGMWPLLAARSVSVGLFGVLAMVRRVSVRMPGPTASMAVGGGVLDMLANLLYQLAAHRGPLSLVVTLSSLYPASTVVLARVVLGERLNAEQWLGVAAALVATVLIVSA